MRGAPAETAPIRGFVTRNESDARRNRPHSRLCAEIRAQQALLPLAVDLDRALGQRAQMSPTVKPVGNGSVGSST